MTSKAMISFLVTMMLVTGVCNTLLSKFQDNVCVRDCSNPKLKERKHFEQPVIQTVQMFIGEMGSWLFVAAISIYRRYFDKGSSRPSHGGYQPVDAQQNGVVDTAADGRDGHHGDFDVDTDVEADRESIQSMTPITKVMSLKEERIPLVGWKLLLLALPAICDICGTTLMNVGLLFVAASIFQMTRGALVLFVGLFSVIFLRRTLHRFQWYALFTVVLGVAIVGMAGVLYKDHKPGEEEEESSMAAAAVIMLREALNAAHKEAHKPETLRAIIGVLLIAGAQIFTASQFVIEEHILEKYALEPLKVVGWEGLFGFSITVIAMIVMYFAVGRTDAGRYGYWDLVEAWREVTEYKRIGVSSVLIMISIGGFNFFGLSVTRSVSATARSTIDTCRTLFIWIVSLFLGWESFKWLQVLGFVLLVYGTFLFNGLVRPPFKSWLVREGEGDVEELLPEEPIEHR